MRRERNALNWLAAEYLGADPNCTITAPEHVCQRRDGRLVRDGQEDCHASASLEVSHPAEIVCDDALMSPLAGGKEPADIVHVCALCLNRDPLMAPWNQSLVEWRGTWAHKGCADDADYDRMQDYLS